MALVIRSLYLEPLRILKELVTLLPLFHIEGIHMYIQNQVHVSLPKAWQIALHIKKSTNNNALQLQIYISTGRVSRNKFLDYENECLFCNVFSCILLYKTWLYVRRILTYF